MQEQYTEPQLLAKACAMLGIKMSERDARCAMKFVVLLREKGNDATLREIEAIPFSVETEIKNEMASNQRPMKLQLEPNEEVGTKN